MGDFIHLHNHSDYSLLDAAQTVERMCNRVYDLGMDSIAVTDHGNLFAMIPFYKEAQKKTEQIGRAEINEHGIYIRFSCSKNKRQKVET